MQHMEFQQQEVQKLGQEATHLVEADFHQAEEAVALSVAEAAGGGFR